MKTKYGNKISQLSADLVQLKRNLIWAEQERKEAELTTSREMYWRLMANGFEEWEASLHGDEILMSDRKDAKEKIKQISSKISGIKREIKNLQRLNTNDLLKLKT